jgi:transcriptional/translational regulatory protein YebC/TACO1
MRGGIYHPVFRKRVPLLPHPVPAAVAKGSGQGSADDSKPLLIEISAPNALFILVEAEAAQRELVTSDLRRELRKLGGTLGKEGSASWAFSRVGWVGWGQGENVAEMKTTI